MIPMYGRPDTARLATDRRLRQHEVEQEQDDDRRNPGGLSDGTPRNMLENVAKCCIKDLRRISRGVAAARSGRSQRTTGGIDLQTNPVAYIMPS